jgi:formate hydrogenlyase subunit 3/multisubunit Na+/H+ antiporter MnhD subunit
MAFLDTIPWPICIIFLPLSAAIFAFLIPRVTIPLALTTVVGILLSLMSVTNRVWQQGAMVYSIGGWDRPLAIELYVDGLSIFMLAMTALVGTITSLYAMGYFGYRKKEISRQTTQKAGQRVFFWPLWLFMWAAMNALFLSADIFNLYVTLELLGISAVSLVALAKEPEALAAAMRYLLVSLVGSLSYLLGVGLLYGMYGTLNLYSLGQIMSAGPASQAAMALMLTGLVLKTALFPLHFWLPPAHSSAPAPVSALLSALVVKASYYLMLRLWFEVFPDIISHAVAQFMGGLGSAAIIWGSIQALTTQRFKLLVAYSTVGQLGYLFLVLPLTTVKATGFSAWGGGLYFALCHACAKATLFLTTGTVRRATGDDRITTLDGIGQQLPVSMFALAVAGVSLMGLPPSGGFIAKWMLLNAALAGGQWWWAVVILGGSLLAAVYMFRIFSRAFRYVPKTASHRTVPASMEWTALTLSIFTLALGLIAPWIINLLHVGAPVSGPVLTGGLP